MKNHEKMQRSNTLMPKIILFGDSLTQRSFEPKGGCWGSYFADKFQRICDIIPRGFSGYNTRWCREILDDVFDPFNFNEVACVLIWLGANDASGPNSSTKQNVPIDEYGDNLRYFVEYFEKKGLKKKQLIFATPPPYNHVRFAATFQGSLDKSPELTEAYAAKCAEIAQECGITLANFHAEFSKRKDCDDLFVDGLHFSSLGGEEVFKILDPLITEKYENFIGQKFNQENMIFPYWKDRAFKQ